MLTTMILYANVSKGSTLYTIKWVKLILGCTSPEMRIVLPYKSESGPYTRRCFLVKLSRTADDPQFFEVNLALLSR